MKSNHDVLVATPWPDGEATAVIGLHLSDGLLVDVDLAEQDYGEEEYRGFSSCYFVGGGLGRLRFFGAYSLAYLYHVNFYGISRFQELFSCVGKSECRLCGVVTCFDYSQPRVFDG